MHLLDEQLSLEDRMLLLDASTTTPGRDAIKHVLFKHGVFGGEEPPAFESLVLDAFMAADSPNLGYLYRAYPIYGAAVRVMRRGGSRWGGDYLCDVLNAS